MPKRDAIADPIPTLEEQVADAIVRRLDGWTQPMAAELLRTDQPRVSDLRRGNLDRFSLGRLIRFAARLHGTVGITIAFPR